MKKRYIVLIVLGAIMTSIIMFGTLYGNLVNESFDKEKNTSRKEQQFVDNYQFNKNKQSDDNKKTENRIETEKQKDTTSYEITNANAVTWVNSINSTECRVVVEIENTGNTNLYLSSGSYELEDSSGKLVACKSYVSTYPEVLAPGEKGYMYDVTYLDDGVEGKLTVVPHPEVEKAEVDLVRLDVSDIAISERKYGGIKMLGRVKNTSDEEQTWVYVVAFLYDSDGACIGVMDDIVTDGIAVGDQIGFEMSDYDIELGSVSTYTVCAYPWQIQF